MKIFLVTRIPETRVTFFFWPNLQIESTKKFKNYWVIKTIKPFSFWKNRGVLHKIFNSSRISCNNALMNFYRRGKTISTCDYITCANKSYFKVFLDLFKINLGTINGFLVSPVLVML